ncbi:type 4b pilus protein PilO2 [Trinickia diaoshuihuensis]|uniref:type 4b pilus protein PilO2 n=1 Tax=Trinickia diaoshuihuensis TaxID=2292265 RepID=UPI000E2588A0|nr:type 4b pilus protein PilO2 [Trinickia diaoshuihuensis]
MAELITLPGVKGTFAAGLSWRHEDKIPRAAELRALSMEKGRWGLVRRTIAGSVQVGFCEPIAGASAPSKVKALATIVAEQRPQPWMGLYKLGEDRYWYIAVRDGQEVIPEGDQIGKLDDLLRVREQHLTLGDWEEAEGTLDDLAEMALSTPKHLVLRDLQRRPWVNVAVASSVLLVIGAAGGGAWFYRENQLEKEREAEAKRQRAIAAALHARDNAQAHILPWTQTAMPSSVFDACRDAWREQPLARDGWMLSSWECRAQPHGIDIHRGWVSAGGLAANAPGKLSSDARSSAEDIQHQVAFAAPSPRADLQPAARRALWTLAQRYGFALTIDPPTVPRPIAPGENGAQAVPDPWQRLSASIAERIPPWSGLGPAFDSVPGLRVEALAWTAASRRWALSMALYTLDRLPAQTVPHPLPAMGAQPSREGQL